MNPGEIQDSGTIPPDLDEVLDLNSFPKRPMHLSGLPEPVHELLDDLVNQSALGGAPTNRSKFIGALIINTASRHLDNSKVANISQRYEGAKVRRKTS